MSIAFEIFQFFRSFPCSINSLVILIITPRQLSSQRHILFHPFHLLQAYTCGPSDVPTHFDKESKKAINRTLILWNGIPGVSVSFLVVGDEFLCCVH